MTVYIETCLVPAVCYALFCMYYTCFLIRTIILQEQHRIAHLSYRWRNRSALWVKVAGQQANLLGYGTQVSWLQSQRKKYCYAPPPSTMTQSQSWLNQMGVLAFHRLRLFNELIINYADVCILPKSCSPTLSSIAIPSHNNYTIHANTTSSLKFEVIAL